jgi:hypothetical protein
MTIRTDRDDRGRTVYRLDTAAARRAPYLAGTSPAAMAEHFARHTARRPARPTRWNTWADGSPVRDAAELVFRVRYRDALRDVADRLRAAGAASPMRNGVREEDVCRVLDYGGRRIVWDRAGVMSFAPSESAQGRPAGEVAPDTRTPRPSARSAQTRARLARVLAASRTPVRRIPAGQRVVSDDAALLRTGGVHVL